MPLMVGQTARRVVTIDGRSRAAVVVGSLAASERRESSAVSGHAVGPPPLRATAGQLTRAAPAGRGAPTIEATARRTGTRLSAGARRRDVAQ